jgi:hypothetical protein
MQEKIPSRPDAIRELLKRALCAAEQRGARAKRNRRSDKSTGDATGNLGPSSPTSTAR